MLTFFTSPVRSSTHLITRRARGMSFVLFAAVSGAVFGPLVFGPLFSNRALTPHELVLPWLGSSLFALAGLLRDLT